ncbi:MAG: class III signal peptide-containing protein [Methanosphaera sp.]|nr:class III signal peptide-containing protein [Methanosphaera sp.]
MYVKLTYDNKAQVSAELLLLIAGLMVIVLIAINIYQQYLNDFAGEINDTELKELIDRIDALNDYF